MHANIVMCTSHDELDLYDSYIQYFALNKQIERSLDTVDWTVAVSRLDVVGNSLVTNSLHFKTVII